MKSHGESSRRRLLADSCTKQGPRRRFFGYKRRELSMVNAQCDLGGKRVSNAEIQVSLEAIGQLHYILGKITGQLATAKNVARTLLDHSGAIPGGVPSEAAVAVAKLRLEVAHNETLTLDTLRAVVEAIPVPEVELSAAHQQPQKDP
jgi:hypothetical protein